MYYNNIMPRIKLKKNVQIKFFESVRLSLATNYCGLANTLGVHPRSLSDWRRGKFTIPKKVFDRCLLLSKESVQIPLYEIVSDFWSAKKFAKKGGLARSKIYGSPGTVDGRKKGGLISQKRRRLHPELFKHCNIRKEIIKPKNSNYLAELFGIILGDGGINSNHQVVITLNSENDKQYSLFVSRLIKKIFGLKPFFYKYHSPSCKKVVGVTINSTAVVEFLLKRGLLKGSKVKHQIDVPNWIKNKATFSKSCLRGLMDTDGGVYYHRHISNGCKCLNIGLCFSNKSLPLLSFVKDVLSANKFNPKLSSNGNNIFLYRKSEVVRYTKKIGFSNPYHLKRIREFFKDKELRKDAGEA